MYRISTYEMAKVKKMLNVKTKKKNRVTGRVKFFLPLKTKQ